MHMSIDTALTHRLALPQTRKVNFALSVICSLFIAIAAQVSFRVPFSPVPITGQTFAVLLVAVLFGRQRAIQSVLLYLAEGIAGLPVFAGGGAGIAWLMGPTGGYLAGFVLAAALVGHLSERGFGRHLIDTLAVFAAGHLVIYLAGAIWLSMFIGMESAIQAGILPFLIGDVFKIALAAITLPAIWHQLD